MSGLVVPGPKSDDCDSSELKNRFFPFKKKIEGGRGVRTRAGRAIAPIQSSSPPANLFISI